MPSGIPWETCVTRFFLPDPCPPSSNCRDLDPWGSYILGRDGRTELHQSLRAIIPMFPFEKSQDLDAAILGLLLTAAKHSNRFRVVSHSHMRSSVGRVGSGTLFFGPVKDPDMGERWFPDKGVPYACIPPGCVIGISGNPEENGVVSYHDGLWGFVLLNTSNLFALRVVPDSWDPSTAPKVLDLGYPFR
jgi:hypothetical protein